MFLKNLLKYNDAKSIVFKKLDELMHSNYKSINIIDSWNKISFEDVAAPENLPMFDKSAMDGYALIAQDTFGASENNPIILNLVEEGNLIKSNECMKVSTGMAIPNGANSVVMKEYCIEGDNFVEVRKGVYPYENVSKMGEDVNKGDIIIKKGEIITPYHIALLSSLGIKNIKVYDINVGLISTGDELVDLNNIKDTKDIEKLKKRGNIINSNTPMLYALIKEMG
ncbi:MAG TPA: molybdopterin molybdenumtransferase MoeA, partial [Methanothermococcus okinawensis]|nr:molybdopterin molybdenumtransferase MoeA [Methanothermococcus okinawensis]